MELISAIILATIESFKLFIEMFGNIFTGGA